MVARITRGVCTLGERYHRIGVTEKQSWIWKRASGAGENVAEGGYRWAGFVLAS